MRKLFLFASAIACIASAAPSFARDILTPIAAPTSDTVLLRAYPGDSFVSPDGRFRFSYQNDGNLVLYQNGVAIWESDTEILTENNGYAPGYAAFQKDGNLVVYNYRLDRPALAVSVWDSNTWKNNTGATIAVQNDGNVVIYGSNGRAKWSTKTCCR
jgi:hypothetical protein